MCAQRVLLTTEDHRRVKRAIAEADQLAPVSRPFSSWNRPVLTEIYLCHACSCQDIILRAETAGQVACRILPSSHTNPIFVLVGEQPIRAYRRSVEWCLQGERNGRIHNITKAPCSRAVLPAVLLMMRCRLPRRLVFVV